MYSNFQCLVVTLKPLIIAALEFQTNFGRHVIDGQKFWDFLDLEWNLNLQMPPYDELYLSRIFAITHLNLYFYVTVMGGLWLGEF